MRCNRALEFADHITIKTDEENVNEMK